MEVFVLIAFLFLVGILILAFWGLPRFGVYQRRLAGVAALAEAQAEAEVTVREARAERDAAVLLAEAEVAKATEIVGKALHENEGYLRYLWIERLNNQNAKIIYVPTEGGLPLLEAGRTVKSVK